MNEEHAYDPALHEAGQLALPSAEPLC